MTAWELGDTYKKPITQTETFYPAVLSEDKGKPMRISAPCVFIRNDTTTLSSSLGFQFQTSVPIGTTQAKNRGCTEPRPLEGSGPKASLLATRGHHAVEKKKAKSFHVVLYICGSIYRAGCALIPEQTFSLPALWALITARRDACSTISRPGSQRPSAIFLSCRKPQQHRAERVAGARLSPSIAAPHRGQQR